MNLIYKNIFIIKTALILGSLVFALYFINIRPALGSFYIVKGTNENKKIQTGFYRQSEVLKDFRQGLDYGSFGRAENSMTVGDYALTLFDTRSKVFSEDIKVVFDLAIQEVLKTIKDNPEDARFRAMLGMLYLKFSEYDAVLANLAERAFEETLKISPNRPDILFFLSKAELAAGDNEKAIDVLQQAIALAPTYAEFNSNLPIYFFINGDVERAREAANTMRKIFKDRFQLFLHLEELMAFYKKYNLYNEMAPFYEDAMALEPTNVKWPLGLMDVYLKLDNREKAKEMAKKAVKLTPSLRESLTSLLQ